MSNDAYSDNELPYNSRSLQRGFSNSIHATSYDKIEMNIGHWYLDQFGNRTREITARTGPKKSTFMHRAIQIVGLDGRRRNV